MNKITKILGAILNLRGEEEKMQKEPEKMTLPQLLQSLFGQMKRAEDNVTLAMAQVGLKRQELASLLAEREDWMNQAEAHERAKRQEHAKAALSQALAQDKRISECTEQLGTMDSMAQQEIQNFRELERNYQAKKSQVRQAEMLKPFNQMISRMNNTVDQFDDAVRREIDDRLNQQKLAIAQQVSRIALKTDGLREQSLLREGRQLLEEDQLDREYRQLQERVLQPELLPEEEESEKLDSPAERARKLLEAPAFGGLIKVRRE